MTPTQQLRAAIEVQPTEESGIAKRKGSAGETTTRTRLRLVGSSNAIRNLRRQVRQALNLDEPALILGPTGTGKEVVAHTLHQLGKRGARPFLAENCAYSRANPQLAHSRLFGHAKGAFTGAAANMQGAFQRASTGTLFLDEVAELPSEVQAMLLRALQEARVNPLGSLDETHVQTRVVAATNEDIAALIATNRFREDLFYRLSFLTLHTPALAERKSDIPIIARSLLFDLRETQPPALTTQDVEALISYEWPGNVRQLLIVVRRAALIEGITVAQSVAIEQAWDEKIRKAKTATTQAADLQRRYRPSTAEEVRQRDEVTNDYVQHVYDQVCNRNKAQAAKLLGIARNTLYKHISGDLR